jgi:hypothetical protein
MKSEEIRKAENARVLELFKSGHGLSKIPTYMTNFPPRPLVKKDLKIIENLYKKPDHSNGEPKGSPE